MREEWFQGKTLTGCANDLHGPYLGPDGWIYWTKGAFAEQTYERPGQPPLVTKAAHIFRRRPGGTVVEPVLTGGMDNPVDVAFTATGERLFTATFLEHPQLGKRDALIHAVYGGVYGKVHGVIDGHPRTGDLLGPVCHLGPAAPAGLTRATGAGFSEPGRETFYAALFNMQKVTRHELVPSGATFTSKDSDFVVADYARLPPDRRHRGRRRQPARRRHRRLVQAVLPDVAAGEAGRAGRDLPRAEARRAGGGRPARPSSRLAGRRRRRRWSAASPIRGRPCGAAPSRRWSASVRIAPLPALAGAIAGHPSVDVRQRALWTAMRLPLASAGAAVRAGAARSRSARPARGGAWRRPLARSRGGAGADRSAGVGGSRTCVAWLPKRSAGSVTRAPCRRCSRRRRGRSIASASTR